RPRRPRPGRGKGPRRASPPGGGRNSSTSPPETVSARTSAVTPAGPDTARAYRGDERLLLRRKVNAEPPYRANAGRLDRHGRLALLRQRGGDLRAHPRAAPGRTRARSRRAGGDRGRGARPRRRAGNRRGRVRRRRDGRQRGGDRRGPRDAPGGQVGQRLPPGRDRDRAVPPLPPRRVLTPPRATL